MRARTMLAAALVTACACSGSPTTFPPRAQVLLFIDPDAPLPDASGKSVALSPLPLFDHLRVDVYACGDEARCRPVTRDLPVDSALLRAPEGLSFGIVPAPGDTALVRAR